MRDFEDLVAWQRARVLTKRVHAVSEMGRFGRHFGLRDQARRAAIYVMSNVAEGFGRYNRREFHRFVMIARGSVQELRSQMYVALDLELVDEATHRELLGQCRAVDQLLSALAATLRRDEQ